MTKGKKRKESRNRSRKHFLKHLGRDMTKEEKMVFCAAFGMGWKEGKKRQRQITRGEMKDKNIKEVKNNGKI